MGLTGLVLGIAVIAIALVILVPLFNDSFASVTEQFYQKVESDTIGKKAVAGDTVCDLKITFYGELDFANQDGRTTLIANPFETNLVVFMNEKTDHPEIAKYEWKNCQPYGETSLLSLFGALSGLELLQQNLLMLDYPGFDLIHGHTHRQKTHTEEKYTRYVLGDWSNAKGNAIKITDKLEWLEIN